LKCLKEVCEKYDISHDHLCYNSLHMMYNKINKNSHEQNKSQLHVSRFG